ncbi:hypothetical protein [Yoonia sp. BS5-3]|uniref:Sulfotransferase family protein n=1 Tax=Yoonia phaeophyticola TaxID=3137369 RepID=A0ABZ2V5A1_9RHOB
MQIAFHIGANCTDEDRLLKSILKNADPLLKQGIAVPGPSRYRSLIRETIQGLGQADPAPDARDILLDAIVDNDELRRVVLSNDNFICIPKRIFDHGVFYPQAEHKVRGLRRLFPQDEITLYLSIRNPVTFLQETYKRTQTGDFQTYLGLLQPEDLRWSDMIKRIKSGAPDVPLVVWCNEDSPLLWDQLIRSVSGISPDQGIAGGFDLLSHVLTADGLKLLKARLAEAPPQKDVDRHEMIADIWEKHAITDAVEDEIDLLELPSDVVDRMTQTYEEDLNVIAALPGVQLMLPFGA